MSATRQRRVAVITDTTADLTPDLIGRYEIGVVPLTVTIDGESFDDGSISQAEFFRRMEASPELPTTSLPSVGAFVDAYRTALETADEVVSVHVSSKLSGTFDAARTAAAQFSGYVHVFDSLNLSWGLGWQVLDAARAVRDGATAAEALEVLADVRDRVRHIVSIDSLENLRKGGRIGAVASAVGSLLNLKVTIAVTPEGAFEPLGRHRGSSASLQQLLEWVATQMGAATSGRFAVGHAMSPEAAERLAHAISERWETTELITYEAGTSISAHAGTIWGVAFVPDATASA